MKSKFLSCFTILAALTIAGTAKADTIADGVNTSFAADNGNYWGSSSVGWFYTPSTSYDLSGIYTMFSIPNLTIIQNRSVTTVLYLGDTPSNGGTLLGSFQFDSALAQGQLGGGFFAAPIALTAGQQYFVGFQDVGPLSPTPNVNDLGVNFTAAPGATFLSNLHYDDVRNAGCTTPNMFACVDPNVDILGQPILQFFQPDAPSPSVPEPASMMLLGGGLAGMAFWKKYRSAIGR